MPDLYIGRGKIDSIFQLLGEKENDISYSVGWALVNCRVFLKNFLAHISISEIEPGRIKINLQKYDKSSGFTDFEIVQEGDFHIIIEAKRGWQFPNDAQLHKYSLRPSFANSAAKDRRIIVLNETHLAYTQTHFKRKEMNGIPVQVVSWKEVEQIAGGSKKIGYDAENRMLKELSFYLNKISTMKKSDSNKVYVVTLGWKKEPAWDISWRDIVRNKLKYFHPVGGGRGGWPSEPPNYIAFRFDGKLQSIHHIEKFEVFVDPNKHFPEIPSATWGEHYLYHLGPAFRPGHEVKTGNRIPRSMRVWAALDLLLTSQTVEEARDKTKLREQNE